MWGKAGSPRRRAWIVGAAVVLLLGVIYLAVKPLPEALANTDGLLPAEARAEVGRVRTALLASLAGLIAAAGALLSRLTYQLNRQVATQTHARDLQGQITERFTRAIDQLGNSTLDIRLGGIYALERIARDSDADYPQIIEVLTAFIRVHAPRRLGPADPDAGEAVESRTKPRADVQAALTVLGRRDAEREVSTGVVTRLDLSTTSLWGADLRDADLRSADLTATDLEAATLMWANLERAQLSWARLDDAKLPLARLAYANLTRATLKRSSLSSANLEQADLSEANLEGAFLAHAHLEGAHLREAQLGRAVLSEAHLERADLSEADLRGVRSDGAHFEEAILRKANLADAVLIDADLRGADLRGASLAGAVLGDAPSYTGTNALRNARIDDRTVPPHPEFDWEASGAIKVE
jgi:uncharacterized protein YjbI with pentapeptide repeats